MKFSRPVPRDSRRLQNDASNLQPLNREAEEFLSRSSTPRKRVVNVERRRRSESCHYEVARVYCTRAHVAVSPISPPSFPRKIGREWGCIKNRQGGSLLSSTFRLKFNARRTARVIGRDLFKRENYPEGVVEHRRF